MPEINLLAIIVAAVAMQALGFMWYGPVFGKQWLAAMGWGSEKAAEMKNKEGMGKMFALAFLASFVMAYVLASVIWAWRIALGPDTNVVQLGAMTGFFSWLGFVLTTSAASVLFEGRSKKLYLVNNAYNLTGLVMMGVIIALF